MSLLFRSLRSKGLTLSVSQKAALSSYAPRLSSFEERWLKLGQAEREQIAAEYESLQKADWKNLTIDQKKIRKPKPFEKIIKFSFSLHYFLWSSRTKGSQRGQKDFHDNTCFNWGCSWFIQFHSIIR